MVSLQKQVTEVLLDDTNLTLKQIKKKFQDYAPGTVKSCYYRAKKVANKSAINASGSKITMENMEALLVKQLKKKSDVNTLRLMVDFLKIKQQDKSELKEIDLEIFYKKAMED